MHAKDAAAIENTNLEKLNSIQFYYNIADQNVTIILSSTQVRNLEFNTE